MKLLLVFVVHEEVTEYKVREARVRVAAFLKDTKLCRIGVTFRLYLKDLPCV
jgi:hypothetical protein